MEISCDREYPKRALADFFAVAGLDSAAIGELDGRIRLDGYWVADHRPSIGNLPYEDILYRTPQVDEPITHQVTRIDSRSGLAEVVLTLESAFNNRIEIAAPSVYWDGPGEPVPVRRRDGSISFDIYTSMSTVDVVEAILRIRERSRARFRRCPECDEINPPEFRMSDGICRGCAQRNHGVVF